MKAAVWFIVCPVILLGACRTTVHRGVGFGGGFSVISAVGEPATSAPDSASLKGEVSFHPDVQNPALLQHFASSWSGRVAGVKLRAGSNVSGPKPIRIDSLPRFSKFNAADSMLHEAQDLLRQYDQGMRQNNKWNIFLAVILSLIGIDLVIILLADASKDNMQDDIFMQLFFLGFMLLTILVAAIAGVGLLIALLTGVISKSSNRRKLNVMRKKAVDHILNAPRYAPANRRIEYELRSLRMLRNELTWPQAQSKILQMRRMMNDDPTHPWYPLLRQTAQELQIPWTVL